MALYAQLLLPQNCHKIFKLILFTIYIAYIYRFTHNTCQWLYTHCVRVYNPGHKRLIVDILLLFRHLFQKTII